MSNVNQHNGIVYVTSSNELVEGKVVKITQGADDAELTAEALTAAPTATDYIGVVLHAQPEEGVSAVAVVGQFAGEVNVTLAAAPGTIAANTNLTVDAAGAFKAASGSEIVVAKAARAPHMSGKVGAYLL